MNPTTFIENITVSDPDTNQELVLEIRKDSSTGAIVGIDQRYLANPNNVVRSPYKDNETLGFESGAPRIPDVKSFTHRDWVRRFFINGSTPARLGHIVTDGAYLWSYNELIATKRDTTFYLMPPEEVIAPSAKRHVPELESMLQNLGLTVQMLSDTTYDNLWDIP